MPVELKESEIPELTPDSPRRKKWTREEVLFFDTTEMFAGTHYELIEGELIDKTMAKNRPHSNSTHRVFKALAAIFGLDRVQAEPSIDVGPEDNPTSIPEPDIVVLNRHFEEIADRYPRPDEIALVVEVAASTLAFDLRAKAALYARAGLTDYWVFDIGDRRLIVFREPKDGQYRSRIEYSEHETVAPLAAPETSFSVASAFAASR
ncbi:MAG: Uma2 family endonuclease [Bryobacteraceae bacterium]|nr:Uma2 family endonuclease [Bryobacteraceae bacterium]